MDPYADTIVSFPRFSLNISHCGSGFCFWKHSQRYVTSSDVKNKFGMDKLSLLSKLLFRLLSGVFLIKQIESLSFSIDSVQQTDPTVCAYWVTKPSIFFLEKQSIHTPAIEPQMRSEKFRVSPSAILQDRIFPFVSPHARREPICGPRKQ